MKIAFVGKGGSGKTTSTSLFARYLASLGKTTLVIDADINQHLASALGLPEGAEASLPWLTHHEKEIKEYLRGSNPRIKDAASIAKTTPPGAGSRLIQPSRLEQPLAGLARDIAGTKLLVTGPLEESDVGLACFHGKITIVETLLNHMIDGKDEYVIVDMTAGADSFSSGLFTKFDVTFLVAEPTRKSLDVYKQFKEQAAPYGVTIKVIGNKVENEDDISYLRQCVGTDLLGAFSRSPYVKSGDRGEVLPIEKLEKENTELLARMRDEVDSTPKDWNKFYRQTVEFHIKNAKSWMNQRFGQDFTVQVDPTFNLADHVQ